MDNKLIVIENNDGSTAEARLVTYLLSEDQQMNYVVYTFDEKGQDDGEEIIYISRIARNGDSLYLEEIQDNNEWMNVQMMLKKIANA
ncbi:MAG: DUF1292 domain-containing protein [Bacilli bacterium]|nr:DUF1292 domain-containing protein [Bacilli bacterium]